MQVDRAAHLRQLVGAVELRGDGDRVGGLTPAVEVEDAVEDHLVRRTVEVRALQGLHDVGDRVLAEEHAAEHRLLGGDVLRRLPVVGRGRR